MTLIFVIFATIYSYDPTLLGFPPKLSDDNEPEYIVEISSKKLKELEKNMILKKMLMQQYDSISASKKKLNDSLLLLSKQIKTLEDSSQKTQGTISEKDKMNIALADTINRINKVYNNTARELKSLKNELETKEKLILAKRDSNQVQHYKAFAKIYNNSNPGDVAKILEKIDEPDAAMILKFMNQKKAGKVIEALNTNAAASILLLNN